MKTVLPLALAAVCCTQALAQAPEAFSYQAVARDAGGDPLANTTVGVQFQLHQSTAVGTVVYAETHSPTTNELGLFSVEVGSGVPTTGTFGAIDWSAGPYFLEVGLDPAGGSSYTSVGTQQLLSVPYALHARTADTLSTGVHWELIGNELQNMGGGPVRVNENMWVEGGVFLNNAVNFPGWDISAQSGSLTFNELFQGPRLALEPGGNVGIGTEAPDTTLHVVGKLKYQDGSQADKRVLTSDGNGHASWQQLTAESMLASLPPFTPNPACTEIAATVPTGGAGPWAMALSESHAFVVNKDSSTLTVIDISDPTAPVVIDIIPSGGDSPRDIVVEGNYAYVVNTLGNNLTVFNVSDPANVISTGTVAITQPYKVEVANGYVYVLAGPISLPDLHIYNAINPNSIFNAFSYYGILSNVRDLQVDNGNIYLLVDVGFASFQLSNPYTIGAILGQGFSTGANSITFDIHLDHLYLIDEVSDHMEIFDISNPVLPAALGTYPAGDSPSSIWVQGELAFVANRGSNELAVYDVSTPSSSVLVSTVQAGDAPSSVAASGNYAFLVNAVSNDLMVFSLSCDVVMTVDPNTGAISTETVDLTPFWTTDGSNILNANSGNVGIGVTDPSVPLEVKALNGGSEPGIGLLSYNQVSTPTWGSGISFALDNSTNSKVTYGRIYGVIDDNTAGQEDGWLQLGHRFNGSMTYPLFLRQNRMEAYGLLATGEFPGAGVGTPSYSGVCMGFDGATNIGHIASVNATTSRLQFSTKSGAGSPPVARMTIDDQGDVGIGTTGPAYKLDVVGEALNGNYVARVRNFWTCPSVCGDIPRALLIQSSYSLSYPVFVDFQRTTGTQMGSIYGVTANSIGYGTTSDRRLKTDFTEARKGLADLLEIDVLEYAYKLDPEKRLTGFIAQQLFEHYPQAVKEGGEDAEHDPWMVDYGSLTPLIVKAVQEQQAIIDAQQQRIEELTRTVEDKESENGDLKAQVEANTALLRELQAVLNARAGR